MSQNLPLDGHEKLDTVPTCHDILSYDFENDKYTYFDVVKLCYPTHLHDRHKDFPLAPVKKAVKADELSKFQTETYMREYKEWFEKGRAYERLFAEKAARINGKKGGRPKKINPLK